MIREGKIREVPFAAIALAQREMRDEIEAVNWLLQHLEEVLPPDSATAKAIARRATWQEILLLARWEGSFEVASLLEDAMHSLGPQLPRDVRMS